MQDCELNVSIGMSEQFDATYRQRFQGVVEQNPVCGAEEMARNHFLSGSRIHTFPRVLKRYKCGSDGRTSVKGECICWMDVIRPHRSFEITKCLLSIKRVTFFEFLENSNFDLASVSVFRDCSNNLYSHSTIGLGVDGLHDFPESSLAQ